MTITPEQVGFDPDWYLQAYPDVAAAGVDPWEHYQHHGQYEGRQPFLNRAVIADFHLWRGLQALMEPRLQALIAEAGNVLQADYARWALGRWYHWRKQYAAVAQVLAPLQHRPLSAPAHQGPALVLLDALMQLGRFQDAHRVLKLLRQQAPGHADTALAACNLVSVTEPGNKAALCLERLNAWFQTRNLQPLALDNRPEKPLFDRLQAAAPRGPAPAANSPWVSVVVPVFNASEYLPTALRSLDQQTWPNLEILIVDDASCDSSASWAREWAEQTNRPGRIVRVLQHPYNRGAYEARNTGMRAATGNFLTVQDADDWSHPQKIEYQMGPLQSEPDLQATVSHWVRADDHLQFGHWRTQSGWVYRNVSSLLIRRTVFAALGIWDPVRVNADTEYYYRLISAWGQNSIREVRPGEPLAFGRVAPESLSQHPQTHLVSQFGGVRQWYLDAAHRWHAAARGLGDLDLAAGERPFRVPDALQPGRQARVPDAQRLKRLADTARWHDLPDDRHTADWCQQSHLFDALWYRWRYPDLCDVATEPFDHWWRHGRHEGRLPGPASGHLNWAGTAEHPDRPWVLVAAHQAGVRLYGAERSLLDVLAAWQALGVNVALVIPEPHNPDYLEQLRSRAQQVHLRPGLWWHALRPDFPAAIRAWAELIGDYRPAMLYANTLVHHEPLIAARQAGVPRVVHIRELPANDPDLCRGLGASPADIKARTLASAEQLVVNSQAVATAFGVQNPVVLPNVVDSLAFNLPLPGRALPVIGLISSNLRKKGLDDFVALAAQLEAQGVAAECRLIGPDSPDLDALRREPGGLPGNLVLAGYLPRPQDAVAQLDIVLNLSHFEESFGRTLLEAMAAGRAVVAWQRGALPELIQDGKTGRLVAYGDRKALCAVLAELVRYPERRHALGRAAQGSVEARYTPAVLAEGLRRLL